MRDQGILRDDARR